MTPARTDIQHAKPPGWHLYVPKLVTTLRAGYSSADLRGDTIAGLTVAIVALPLAMALAIASGTTPDKGLLTAVIAGFLISALGGSRFQIGGPTGAFVVVVFNVIDKYGYDGLVLATLMAGLMLIVAGLLRLGTWIKYIPQPVVTGFTAGIAVIIFSSQIKDLFGLSVDAVPAEFVDKWHVFWQARETVNPAALLLSAGVIAAILALRRYAPRLPAFLIAVVGAALMAFAFGLQVETIGTRFGGIAVSMPTLALPDVNFARMAELMPSAFTIAFLAGVESLLSAVVADGMTGRRHRSNCELVAQGIANTASALFGGMPATGAIARTATNIRSGARSPVAGMLHAVFLLAFMLVAAPLAAYVPLASLAGVLVIVAWNMSEVDKFRYLLLAPAGDRIVLFITFALTILVDLTAAIEVGVVMAAMLFTHRMAEIVAVQQGVEFDEPDLDDLAPGASHTYTQRDLLPAGVEVFKLHGPLFFGGASRLTDLLERTGTWPKVFILRMRDVPLIDATGVSALEAFVRRCSSQGTGVIVTGIQPQPKEVLLQMGFGQAEMLLFTDRYEAAIEAARQAVEE